MSFFCFTQGEEKNRKEDHSSVGLNQHQQESPPVLRKQPAVPIMASLASPHLTVVDNNTGGGGGGVKKNPADVSTLANITFAKSVASSAGLTLCKTVVLFSFFAAFFFLLAAFFLLALLLAFFLAAVFVFAAFFHFEAAIA